MNTEHRLTEQRPPGRPLADGGLDDGDGAATNPVLAVQRDAALVAEANAMHVPGASFDGPVSVVNSTCQFGGNTFYHGPVTVVLPDGQGNAGVVLSASALGVSEEAGRPAAQAKQPVPGKAEWKGRKGWRSLRRWQRVSVLVGGLLLVLTLCLVSVFLLLGEDAPAGAVTEAVTTPPQQDRSTPGVTGGRGQTTSTSATSTSPDSRLVSRKGWEALPPRRTAPLVTPLRMVIVHHTAMAACSNETACKASVLGIQNMHMFKMKPPWDDIGYNFLVGGDGYSYEGRGWDVVGAHTASWNAVSLGVALIGNFCEARVSADQHDALERLLELGVRLGKLREDYAVQGRCELNGAISPGTYAMEDIKTLSHWKRSNSSKECTPCDPT
ncbi:uncharacterized protein LOC117653381 [Thrips palmi]|uniref:Uncharacterized protein LOC117653381 n=1 Tax=Thrips palmi TaxID=161013 RepID=A0A6P9ABQ6_THRPL|nr:uncharacterized protein LOC117653381 [Thrips palmi]